MWWSKMAVDSNPSQPARPVSFNATGGPKLHDSVNIWAVNAHTKCNGGYHNFETRGGEFY